jgi:hypothetical protein
MLFFAKWRMLVVTLALGLSLFPNTSGFIPQRGCSIGTTKCGHYFSFHVIKNEEEGIFCLRMSRSRGQDIGNSLEEHWLPARFLENVVDPKTKDFLRGEMEGRSVELAGRLIRQRLCFVGSYLDMKTHPLQPSTGTKNGLVVGRFLDLACTLEGEQILESLFDCEDVSQQEDKIIQGAIMVIQSLLIVGSQLGVKGSPEQLHRSASHLMEGPEEAETIHDCVSRWDARCVRRLKYRNEKQAGVQLLAGLQRKRTPQGAYDLLVEIGAWQKHEDLPLLRSGFSIRFNEDELDEASSVSFLSGFSFYCLLAPNYSVTSERCT